MSVLLAFVPAGNFGFEETFSVRVRLGHSVRLASYLSTRGIASWEAAMRASEATFIALFAVLSEQLSEGTPQAPACADARFLQSTSDFCDCLVQ